jgi:CarD family transcriptional regulator
VRGQPPRHPDDPKAELSELEGTIADASALHPGDRLVYPAQGVCVVVGPEVQEIAGQRLEMVRMRREEDGAAVLVPRGKVASVGLRRVASAELMEGVFHYLAADLADPELNWKIRHRDNADRMVAGGVLGIAEVVKGLHSLSRIRPLPTKERGQYDNARHLLVAEVAASLGVSPGLAEDLIDYALMPPIGTHFKLKPPPKPILMPSRPPRRRIVVEEDEDVLDDLGLEELGIEGLGEEPGAEAVVEGTGEAAEGEGEEAAEGLEESAELVTPTALPGAPLRLVEALETAVQTVARPAAKKAPGRTAPAPRAKTAARKPAAKRTSRPAAGRGTKKPPARSAAKKPQPKKSPPKKSKGKKK